MKKNELITLYDLLDGRKKPIYNSACYKDIATQDDYIDSETLSLTLQYLHNLKRQMIHFNKQTQISIIESLLENTAQPEMMPFSSVAEKKIVEAIYKAKLNYYNFLKIYIENYCQNAYKVLLNKQTKKLMKKYKIM